MRGLKKVVAGVLLGMAMLATAPAALAQDSSQPVSIIGTTDSFISDDDLQISFAITNCVSNVATAESSIFTSASYKADSVRTGTVTALVKRGTPSGNYSLTVNCQGQPPVSADFNLINNGTSGSGSGSDEVTASLFDGRFTDEDPRIHIRVNNCDSNAVSASSSIFSSASYDQDTRVVTARIKRGTRSGSYGIRITCRGQATLSGRIRILGTSAGGGGVGGGGGSTPRGGVDSGLGGTAGGSPTAGWLLLLPLLGAGGLTVVLRRRNAAGR